MTQTEIAAEYCRKFRTSPSAVIARVMYKECPEVFADIERARWFVRRARGSAGNHSRKYMATATQVEREANPFSLPKSDASDYPSVALIGSRFFVLSDIHIPYHDMRALTIALKEAKKFKPDHILINGDLLDFYQLSRFSRDPRKRSFAGELESGQQFFGALRKQFPRAEITWKHGNHEQRYEHYLFQKAPELLDVPGMELEQLMHLEDHSVHVIRDGLRLKVGKLTVLHGHEAQSGVIGPVNAARGAFLKFKEPVLVGHHHQTSQHSETTVNGKLITCWSVGCLCDLHPEFSRLNKWGHGAALIKVDSGGAFEVENFRIYQGRKW